MTQVLGSGGVSYAGERETVGAFGELSSAAGRRRWSVRDRGPRRRVRRCRRTAVAGVLRPSIDRSDILALRGSWGKAQSPPSMRHLHSTESQDHPYIECDPGAGSPPRSCPSPNSRQVTRETSGNPDLEPSDSERVAVGAEVRKRGFSAGVEVYRLSRSGLVGRNNADWAMQNLDECKEGDRSNCIERTGGDITIHDSYANIVETGISGITTRFGGSFRTGWGEVGLSGAWRRVMSADREVAGNRERYAISRNAARVRLSARRGGVSAIWTVNYRAGFKNRSGAGRFESWTGHDVVLDWNEPLGLEDTRVAAGVFNLTDAGLTVDTANPNNVDGPTAAGWGRTFFLTLNKRF